MIPSTTRKMNYNSLKLPYSVLISVAIFVIFSGNSVYSAPTSENDQAEDQAALETLLQPEEQAVDDREQAGSDLTGFLNESADPEDSDSDDDDEQAAASNLTPESYQLQQQNLNANSKTNNLVDYGQELMTAAGHYHHHHKKHYVSGKLEMGAESGKKGAFKWHDKHPVGGKGRR